MNDGPGRGAGSAPDSGHNNPRRGRRTPDGNGEEPRVLEGRVIPSQGSTNGSLPPQRRPGQSGHIPGAAASRRAEQRAAAAQPLDSQDGALQDGGGPGSRNAPAQASWQTPGQRPEQEPGPSTQPASRPATPSPSPSPGQPRRATPPRPVPRVHEGLGRSPSGPQESAPAPLSPSFQPRGDRRPDEPDWNALADANDNRRRRRLLMIGAGVVVAAVAAGVVTYSLAGGSGTQEAGASTSPSAPGTSASEPDFPEVTPPPPPDPLEIISSASQDTAPLTTDTIFPGKRFTLGDRPYVEGPTSSTRNCADVGRQGLGPVLAQNDCRQVLRATYTREGVSVTVGIAVFDDKKSANAVREQAVGHIAPLSGNGVGTFCTPVSCWSSANAIGRYAYFTMAGLSNNVAVTSTETKAKQSGRDVSTFAFRQITQRGKDAAGQ